MASIDVSSAFIAKNDILRQLFHKGTGLVLKFFEPFEGGRKYSVSITSGWNHTETKDAEKGNVEEVLKVVEHGVVTDSIVKKASGCEILASDNTFTRYTFGAKSPKNPITKEWVLTVTPNKNDVSTILPAS